MGLILVENIRLRIFEKCWNGWICHVETHPTLQASLYDGYAWKLSSVSASIQHW